MGISIVIPAKNEEDNVESLIDEIVSALDGVADYEIIVVDDGSTDDTYGRLVCLVNSGKSSLRPVRLKRSVGQSTAILAGVYSAKGALIVTMDADGQNDSADIPKLLAEARKFPLLADFCIAGYRKNRKDTPWKRFQSRVANAIRQKILKDGTPDTGFGLKIVPRSLSENRKSTAEKPFWLIFRSFSLNMSNYSPQMTDKMNSKWHSLATTPILGQAPRDTFLKSPFFDHIHRFIPALVRRINGTVVVVEVNHRERQTGVTKYNMLGRLGVGIIDILGVMWLQHRIRVYECIDD